MRSLPKRPKMPFRKHLVPLKNMDLGSVIWPHATSAIYRISPEMVVPDERSPSFDRTFYSNESIWRDILDEKLIRTDINITLDSFFLFQWFPRTPGLFHTSAGRKAREEARSHIISTDNDLTVYDPYGKRSMLEGGIGNLRLKPIPLSDSEYYFVSASSTAEAHEGVPVAIPSILFNQHIDEIVERGAVARKITGKIVTIPDELSSLYTGYRGVPKVYLKIHDIAPDTKGLTTKIIGVNVTAAVSFISEFEGERNVYATYASFDPSDRASLEQSIKWIEEEYVNNKYSGRIITDFDAVTSRFTNVPFSLGNVMNLSLQAADLNDLHLPYAFNQVLELQGKVVLNIQTQNLYMEENKYKITGGQQGAVGDHAHAHDFTQQKIVEKDVDIHALAEELSKLRSEAKKVATEPEHDEEIGMLAAAEKAAKGGDRKTALEKLASAGKWTLDLAAKTGAPIAAAYLKEKLGIK
jgi:hypothetical protein